MSIIFSIKGLVILLIIGIIISYYLKKTNTGKILIIAGFIIVILTSTAFIPKILAENLENIYNPLIYVDNIHICHPLNIIILGSGYSDDNSITPNDQLNTTTLARLSEGVRLYWLLGRGNIVAGGIKSHLSMTQGQVISNAAVSLGISRDSVKTFQITTNNTNGEALGYMKAFGNTGSVILVTDAIHMPRAMMLFQKHGINPIPAPTNHIIKHSSYKSSFSLLPSVRYMNMFDSSMHEYMGMIWLKLGGR